MGSEDLRAGWGVLPVRPAADAPQTGLKATAADGLAWAGAPAAGGPGWYVSAAREESPGQVGTRMSAGSAGGPRVAAPCSSQLPCWRTWRSSPIYIAFVVPLLSCTCSATPKGEIIPLLPRWLRLTLSPLSWENINKWTKFVAQSNAGWRERRPGVWGGSSESLRSFAVDEKRPLRGRMVGAKWKVPLRHLSVQPVLAVFSSTGAEVMNQRWPAHPAQGKLSATLDVNFGILWVSRGIWGTFRVPSRHFCGCHPWCCCNEDN